MNRELNNPNPSVESSDYKQIAYALAVSLGQKLTRDNYTVATAESCTGGQLSAAITSAAGASAYFNVGVCTYSNDAKIQYCNVSSSTISLHGAVSGQVAEEMAAGIREAANSTYGLATTGIAGPTGGSISKPIGTVFLGLATATKTEHLKLSLTNLSRTDLTACSTIEAIKFILSKLN